MSALALDLPVSPELVLVSPPEQAALARDLLPDPAGPTVERARRLGVLAFWAFCVSDCLAPLALYAFAAG